MKRVLVVDRKCAPPRRCTPFALLLAVLVAAVPAAWVAGVDRRRRQAWDDRESHYCGRLVAGIPPPSLQRAEAVQPPPPPSQRWDEVPPAVRRYLHRVFRRDDAPLTGSVASAAPSVDDREDDEPRPVKVPSRASFKQVGHFRISDGWWAPYEAHQTTTSRGFLWTAHATALGAVSTAHLDSYNDSTTTSLDAGLGRRRPRGLWRWLRRYMDPLATISICDAFVWTEPSYAQVSWRRGALPLLDSTPPPSKTSYRSSADESPNDFESTLWRGEAIRWVAELTLLPHLLLPGAGHVVWSEDGATSGISESRALLEVPLSTEGAFAPKDEPPVRLTATFDRATGMLAQLRGERPFLVGRNKTFALRTWVARFGDYSWSDDAQLWHPTRVEAGWAVDDSGGRGGDPEASAVEVAVRAQQTHVEYDFAPSPGDETCSGDPS